MARGSGRGGHHPPHSPAPVSGPGAMSARTDGGAANPILLRTGGKYGERQALEQVAGAAPLAQAAAPAAGPSGMPPGAPPMPDMYAPTERPNEPITAGAAI